MPTPVQIINRIDAAFNPSANLPIEEVHDQMRKIREDAGDEMFFACWSFSHRTLAAMSETIRKEVLADE